MFLTGKVTSADANTGQVSWGGYQVVITQSLHVDDVTQSVDQSFGVWEDGGSVVEVQDKVAPDTMIGVESKASAASSKAPAIVPVTPPNPSTGSPTIVPAAEQQPPK